MSKVELYEKIRLAARDERLSVRALAARFRVHRREVRAALMSPEPAPRKTPQRVAPLTGVWHGWIREVLVADRDAPRKQRHTANRIRDRLAEEQGVLISESQCRAVVAKRSGLSEFRCNQVWIGHWSLGKQPRARTARRTRALRLSMAFVEKITLRTSSSNARNGTNSAQHHTATCACPEQAATGTS